MIESQPEPLNQQHQLEPFESGVASLDQWLKHRALRNQASGASRTYVICQELEVVGYYTLVAGALSTELAVGRFRRNMPEPIPVVLLARLAVSSRHQGQALGRALVRDAALRVISAADLISVRGMVVHAISDDAVAFYRHVGFDLSPREPRTMMITLSDLRAGFS